MGEDMIGKVYRWLFDAHRHEWETISSADIQSKDGRHIGVGITLRCKKCGIYQMQKLGLWS